MTVIACQMRQGDFGREDRRKTLVRVRVIGMGRFGRGVPRIIHVNGGGMIVVMAVMAKMLCMFGRAAGIAQFRMLLMQVANVRHRCIGSVEGQDQ